MKWKRPQDRGNSMTEICKRKQSRLIWEVKENQSLESWCEDKWDWEVGDRECGMSFWERRLPANAKRDSLKDSKQVTKVMIIASCKLSY